MKHKTSTAVAGLVLGCALQWPAHAGTVMTFDDAALSCPSVACGIGTSDGNLAEGVQGYAAVPGFDGRFAWGTRINAYVQGIGAHSTISIDFLLAVIDSWDGLTGPAAPDIFEVTVDGVSVFTAGYDIFNAPDQSAVRGTQLAYDVALGFGPWNDAAYDMASVAALHDIPHTAPNVAIVFSFANSQGIGDESFALEDLRISTNGTNVPAPAAPALLALALAGLGIARRRTA